MIDGKCVAFDCVESSFFGRRRAKGGTLGRWESLASAASVALGRTVSVPATKALAERAGVDLATSYVGRGTKARLAESVRADDAAALADAAAAE